MHPTPALAQTFSADDLAGRTLERRAIEAVIWGMPAVNYELMLQAMLKAGGSNQTLTPNPDAIYLMPFFNTKNGPLVIDVPPAGEDGSFTANIDDIWQMPLGGRRARGSGQGRWWQVPHCASRAYRPEPRRVRRASRTQRRAPWGVSGR